MVGIAPPCFVTIGFIRYTNKDLMRSFLSNFAFLPIRNKIYPYGKDVE